MALSLPGLRFLVDTISFEEYRESDGFDILFVHFEFMAAAIIRSLAI